MAELTLLQWCSPLSLCLVISATKLRVFFAGHGFLCHLCVFIARSVWLLTWLVAVAELYTWLHVVQQWAKQLDPDGALATPVLVLVSPFTTRTVKTLAQTYHAAPLPLGNSPVTGSTQFCIGMP